MKYLRSVMKSVGIGVIVVLIVLIIKNQFSCKLLEDAEYGIPGLVEKGSIENVFLGSSTFRQGLDIEQLLEEMGEEGAYILSYNGNQPVMEFLTLQYLYDQGVTIGTLYVDLYPYTAAASFKISDTKIFLETDLSFKNEIAGILDNEKDWSSIVEMYITSNNELLFTWPIAYPIINGRFHNGGSTVETEALTKQELDKLEVPAESHLNEFQMEYMGKLIALAENHGTKVVFLEIPKYQTVQESESYGRLRTEMLQWLDEKKTEYIVIQCGNASGLSFPVNEERYFSDLIHMSSEGRNEYTRRLLQEIP